MSEKTEGRCSTCHRLDLLIDGQCVTHWMQALDAAEGRIHRYFVTIGDGEEREVDKAEFVRVERRAGFHNTLGFPDEPGTAGFSTDTIKGRIQYGEPVDENGSRGMPLSTTQEDE